MIQSWPNGIIFHQPGFFEIHPGKLTWNPKMMVSNRNSFSSGLFSGAMLLFAGVRGPIFVHKELSDHSIHFMVYSSGDSL